jgi:pimeloyl-ACP methyl ester carboxylesterase
MRTSATNFRLVMPACMALLLAATASAQSASPAQPTPPQGSAFWDTVPTRVPADAKRGDLLWMAERTDAPRNARAWNIVYVTESANKGLEYASGEVYVPRAAASTPRRLLVWGVGTAGFQDSCAPSRTPLYRQNRTTRVPAIETLMDRGYVVAMSDYQGLGVPGGTAYLDGPLQAKASFDAARAAMKIPGAAAGNEVGLYGFSQGGQTVLWAAHLAATYAPELKVVGIAPIAPASRHLDLSFYDLGIPANAGYFIARMAGLQVGHPELHLRDILTPAGLEMLPVMSWGCYEIFAKASQLTEPFARREALAEGTPWRARLEANDQFLPLPTSIPVLLIQGDADIDVPVQLTQAVRRDLCGQKIAVEYHELPEVGHNDAVPPSAALLPDWFDARFAGRQAQDTCPP